MRVALSVLALVSLLPWLGLLGDSWWGYPGAAATWSLAVLVRAGAVWVVLRWALPALQSAQLGRCGLALLSVIATFRAVAVVTPIGDFEVAAMVAAGEAPLGKWYGSSLVLRGWHLLAGVWSGLSPEASIRWLSAICGGCLTLLVARFAGQFDGLRRCRAWTAVYSAAFGVVGVAAGHVEIYALVQLTIAAWLLAAYRFWLVPQRRQAIVLGLITGWAAVCYLGLILLAPLLLALLAIWWLRRTEFSLRLRATRTLAICGLALLVVVLVFGFGPTPVRHSLPAEWARQFRTRAPQAASPMPPFLPADVHSAVLANLIAPRYWFSGWHLRDISAILWLGDRVGLVLIAAAAANLRWRETSAAQRAAILLFGSAAVIELVYAALVVHGMPYPWDWDLTTPAFVTTTLFALVLLGAWSPVWPRWGGWVLGAVSFASLISGFALTTAAARPPAAFGPVVDGLQLAVQPTAVAWTADVAPLVTIWIRSERPAFDVPEQAALLAMIGNAGARQVRTEMTRTTIKRGLRIEPGDRPLTRFYWRPELFQEVDLTRDPRGASWQRAPGGWSSGRFAGKFLFRLGRSTDGQYTDLESQPLEIEIAPRRAKP